MDYKTASHAALRSTSRVVLDQSVTETPPVHTPQNDKRNEHDESANKEMGGRRPILMPNGLSRRLDEKPVEAAPSHIISINTDATEDPASGKSDDGWRGIAAFSPNGALLAFALTANMIQVWDPVMGLTRFTFRCDHVASVKFSPTGQFIAFICGSSHRQLDSKSTCRLTIWSLSSQRTVYALEKSNLDIEHLALSWSGQFIAFMNEGGDAVDLHDLVTKTTRKIPFNRNLLMENVIFSPDDQLVTFGKDGTVVRFWDRDTGALLRAFEGSRKGVMTVAFFPDENLMVAVSVNVIRVWDYVTETLLHFFWPSLLYFHAAGSFNIIAISYEPVNQLMAIASSLVRKIEIYDLAEKRTRCKFIARVSGPQPMAFMPDGRLMAADARLTTASDGQLRVPDSRSTRNEVAVWVLDFTNDTMRSFTFGGGIDDNMEKPLSRLLRFLNHR